MTSENFVDDLMGFDPSQVMESFNETSAERASNPNVYKTNPKNSVAEDGVYRSKIRVLLNPYDIKHSIVHKAQYSMRDQRGFFQVTSSLSVGDKSCPIFNGWKKLWYATKQDPSDPTKRIEDTTKKEWAREKFSKTESDWVLVQIIEDENQPDLVGKFKVMKLPKVILERMQSKMNPADPKKQKLPLMDYLFGPILNMEVQPGPDDPKAPERKQREISYSSCDFDTDPTPIIQTNGEQLFTDEEIELIEEYNSTNNEIYKAKTDAKREAAQSRKQAIVNDIRTIYAKAVEYIKVYAINPVVECGYTPWNEDTNTRVNAWLEKVLNMQDPQDEISLQTGVESVNTETFTVPTAEAAVATSIEDDDLPF